MASPKIVRKQPTKGNSPNATLAAWLNGNGLLCGWWEFADSTTADDEIEQHGDRAGWRIDEHEAADCGTTLAALRAELMDSPAPLEAP